MATEHPDPGVRWQARDGLRTRCAAAASSDAASLSLDARASSPYRWSDGRYARPSIARPCAAAHSLTRALFAKFAGPLYQLQRSGDNATLDVQRAVMAMGPLRGYNVSSFLRSRIRSKATPEQARVLSPVVDHIDQVRDDLI